MGRNNIITDIKMVRQYCEQFYANRFKSLDKIGLFLKRYKLSKHINIFLGMKAGSVLRMSKYI